MGDDEEENLEEEQQNGQSDLGLLFLLLIEGLGKIARLFI